VSVKTNVKAGSLQVNRYVYGRLRADSRTISCESGNCRTIRRLDP
jgi:hypothetical protein